MTIKEPKPLPLKFVHAEWITLHNNPDFHDFVAFLRGELDRVGPAEEAAPILRTIAEACLWGRGITVLHKTRILHFGQAAI